MELLLRGADGDGTVLTKDDAFVWLLKVDSFLLHHTILSTTVRASSAEPRGVRIGFGIQAATFNLTMWLNWKFSVL